MAAVDSSHTHSDLLEQARRGEPVARDRLVESLLPDVRAFVRLNAGARIRQLESNTDLVQTICLQLCADLEDYRGTSDAQFRKWLFTLAMNKIQRKGRHHAAGKRDAGKAVPVHEIPSVLAACRSVYSPTRQAAAREELQRLEAAFDLLPDDYREVLNLTCLMGLSHAEAGAQLGRTEEATRKLLSRARARLALELARDR